MENIIMIIIGFIGFFICLTVHEAAHAFVSNKLGDPTAKYMGRLSLNPLAHIDPIGTIIVPLFLILSGLPAFGWAKPVMVNIGNFRKPSVYNFLTAISGPVSNILFAVLLALLIRVFPQAAFLSLLVQINIVLAVFNLIPIPPLDGSKVWHLFLSDESYLTLEQMGPILLIAVLVFSNFTGNFIFDFISTVSNWVLSII